MIVNEIPELNHVSIISIPLTGIQCLMQRINKTRESIQAAQTRLIENMEN